MKKILLLLVMLCGCSLDDPKEKKAREHLTPGYHKDPAIVTAEQVILYKKLDDTRFLALAVGDINEKLDLYSRERQSNNVFNDSKRVILPIEQKYRCTEKDIKFLSDYYKLLGFKTEFTTDAKSPEEISNYTFRVDLEK